MNTLNLLYAKYIYEMKYDSDITKLISSFIHIYIDLKLFRGKLKLLN